MEQFVLVSLSVYNSSNSPTLVTKQELPKYKADQTPRYERSTVKKEIKQHLISSASPLLNEILECPRIKLSKSSALILDGIESAVLVKTFAQHLKRKVEVIRDIYLTLVDAVSITPDFVINSHAKAIQIGD